jgi:hypothetical protein
MGWSLAIDFGTSNTAAAYRLDGGPARPVRLTDQADQMPSAVLMAPDGIKVGLEAERAAQIWPTAFEAAPKSRMGEGEVQLGDRDVRDVALVAAVLRQVLQRARRVAGGNPPDRVVLTHPVKWAPRRRGLLVEAAATAGIGEAVLVPEPVAAASHYGVDRPVPAGGLVAVFDFGGGTCDVAVLRSTGDRSAPFEDLAAAGEDPLGGDLLDSLLLDWTFEQLRAGGDDEVVALLGKDEHLSARLTLRKQVKDVKHALSDDASAVIPVAVAGHQRLLTLTAAELDERLGPRLDQAVELMARALRDAGLTPRQLGALYLTGGSSLMPAVHRRLTALLGRPPETLDDPKLVVALGALDVASPPSSTPMVEPRRDTGHREPARETVLDAPAPPAPAGAPPRRRLAFALPMPPGWSATEDKLRIDAPADAGSVLVTCDPLPPGADTMAVARLEWEHNKRTCPNLQVLRSTGQPVFGGHPGYGRRFTWDADDGPVVQVQLYLALDGRRYVATASAPTASAPALGPQLDAVLDTVRVRSATWVDGRYRTGVLARPPDGWSSTEWMMVAAPNGRTNVLCRSETVDATLGTEGFARALWTAIHERGFPRFRSLAFGPQYVFGGWPGYVHRFQWKAESGVVSQLQACYAEGGRAFLATVTVPVPFAGSALPQVDGLLAGIQLEITPS